MPRPANLRNRTKSTPALSAEEFRSRLKALGISQRQLALRIKNREHTVGAWCNGTSPVPGYAAYILALLERIEQLETELALLQRLREIVKTAAIEEY